MAVTKYVCLQKRWAWGDMFVLSVQMSTTSCVSEGSLERLRTHSIPEHYAESVEDSQIYKSGLLLLEKNILREKVLSIRYGPS